MSCRRAVIAFLLPAALVAQQPTDSLAVAVDREVVRLAGQIAFWPGYRPDTIPLAIFTSDRTMLFRHPAPPEPFHRVRDALAVMPGRHPSVTANSSATIGDRPSATLLADGARSTHAVRSLAAVALHEAFHVFQRARHPRWAGNEGDLFTYPFDRADLLAGRRVEAELLRRALAARGAQRLCLAREALRERRARFALMAPAYVNYEQASELNEGLATWVQLRAEGKQRPDIPAEEYPATALRDRFYTIGAGLAFLLDAVQPGWPSVLERADSLTLDSLLEAALPDPIRGTGCALPTVERDAIHTRAEQDAAAVVAERSAARRAFEAIPGWRVVIEAAAGQPLWPKGFDPLNVLVVEGGVLHRRMLAVGNGPLEASLMDGEDVDLTALTTAAGEHPLFNGMRRVEIAGLAKPTVTRAGDRITLTAPGLSATFTAVDLRERGTTITVTPRAP